MNKRGISAIVATVLIILITVAAVTIVWATIIPMIRDNLDFSALEGMVSVVTSAGYTVYDSGSKMASVQIKRDVDDGVMNRIRIIFSIDGNSFGSSVVAPDSGGMRVYVFNLSEYGKPESVSVAPIFAVGEREKEGSVTSNVKIGEGNVSGSGPVYEIDGDYFGEGTDGQIITGHSLWNLFGENIYYNTGNVGIGTSNPGEKLEVNGAIKVGTSADGTGDGTFYYDTTANMLRYYNSSDWIPFGGDISYVGTLWSESGGNVYRSSGKVGIGTPTPKAKLDVQGDVNIYLD